MNRIAEAACGGLGDRSVSVIEIGPGRGALTESLLEHTGRLIAIEIDPVLVHYLRQKFREPIDAGRLHVIEADVLKTDLAALADYPVLTGNLPYYITSPILEHVFALGSKWRRAVFLVQAEVAERITAAPGSRDFGYLSVLTQVHAEAEILFRVSREAFRPPPKVESAVFRLTPRQRLPQEEALSGFLKFAQLCFKQKRKNLRNNLAPVYGTSRVDALPEARMRAEQLSVEQLMAVYEKLSAQHPPADPTAAID